MRIVFFGTPAFSAQFLAALIADPSMDVVGVVAQPDEPVGRKKILTPPPTKVLAEAHSIPVFQPTKLKDPDFHNRLTALTADAFVVVAYGRIIPQTALDIPRLGCINVHPSLLPKYRGPSPIQSAIAAGETETGVTIMKLDADMDHGPILAQKKFGIETRVSNENAVSNETRVSFSSVIETVVEIGAPLLIETLKKYAAGEIVPHEQNHDEATFCKLLTREDGIINWTQSAEVITRKVGAFTPWPGTSTTWMRNGEPLTIKIFSLQATSYQLQPSLVSIIDGKLIVGTATTAVEVIELQPAGGKRMTAQAFLAGNKDINGASLG